jgi:predicted HD superfamily hydrolase involved in NAD metabolism
MLNQAQAEQIIKARLSNHRFQHSLGVARAARDLAKHYGMDEEKAYLTGILHDYAKNLTVSELRLAAGQDEQIADEAEKKIPELLHAPVGAYLLAHEQGIKDQEILEAVKAHTLGALTMSTLAKIIFLADMIEPNRDIYPELDRLRQLSRQNLDEAMLLGLESTIRYCLDRRALLHPRTVEVRNMFLQKIKGQRLEA